MKNSFMACLPAEDLISFLQSLNRRKKQNEFITGRSSFIQDKPTPWMIKCSQSVNYWAACECKLPNQEMSHIYVKNRQNGRRSSQNTLRVPPSLHGADSRAEGKVIWRTDLEVDLEWTQNYCVELLALYLPWMII